MALIRTGFLSKDFGDLPAVDEIDADLRHGERMGSSVRFPWLAIAAFLRLVRREVPIPRLGQ